ncbi:MAG: hypothetical protein H6742_08520 [Alphaproteobacteria bacterium]|nr:hypothetical protein [Alphaproteobacteria bacterium]
MTTLPMLFLLACGGDEPAGPAGPTAPLDRADKGEAEPPPPPAPAVLSLAEQGADCAVQRRTSADGADQAIATFAGPCPAAPTWVLHPAAQRVLLTWGEQALEVVDVDLAAGSATRLPALPAGVAAAWLPAPTPPPAETPADAPADAPAADGEAPAADGEAPAAAPAPATPAPDHVAAVQLVQTQERIDDQGAYFELDGEQLRYDRQAALMVDLTVVRVQAFQGGEWSRVSTGLWPRKEGMALSDAFPAEIGALGRSFPPDPPQVASTVERPGALDKLAQVEWAVRSDEAHPWAHALVVREEAHARTPVAVKGTGKWALVEGLDQAGPLTWQERDGWVLASDGAQAHLIELATGSVTHGLPGSASFAP